MLYVLYVALGGAFGATLRYFIKIIFGNLTFPFATLIVNLLGCFLMGFLSGVCKGANKAFMHVGLLGAFTTFSSFGIETVDLFVKGSYGSGILNIILNNILGIVLVYFGLKLGSFLVK